MTTPVVAAFNIGNSLQQSTDTIFSYLPKILAFLIILIVGYIIAKVVKAVLNKILDKVKVDQKLQHGKAGEMVVKVSPGGKPSHLIGATAFWIIFLFALSSAIGALQIPALTTFMNQVLAFLPNVIAALLIFIVAAIICRRGGCRGTEDDGRHLHRQAGADRGARFGDGGRGVHDPDPVGHRPANRDHHLHRPNRHARFGRGAGIRPGRTRGRRPNVVQRLPKGQRSVDQVKADAQLGKDRGLSSRSQRQAESECI